LPAVFEKEAQNQRAAEANSKAKRYQTLTEVSPVGILEQMQIPPTVPGHKFQDS
jgi:hypothetical protein